MFSRRTVLKLGALGVAATPLAAQGRASAAADGDASATRSEVAYLSGTDKDHVVDWRFMLTSGRNSGKWTTVPVPSNWEPQGYGTYDYGDFVDDHPDQPNEQGVYEHTFTAPAAWRGRKVFIVFEGSMTDTRVWINGSSVGSVHQGGFVRFTYDVTDVLTFGGRNRLKVTVDKESANASINGAERRGDYWIFGGIYRPVYLLAHPAEFVDRVAVDAQADGSLSVDVFLGAIAEADGLRAQVKSMDGKKVGRAFSADLRAGADKATLSTRVDGPRLWTAETPNLYQLEVTLTKGEEVLHLVTERFGFRTVEVRPGKGIFLNGKRIMLKGITRHAEWPDSGRTTSPTINRDDILLMKEMNINAVRLSHYPQDQNFYDYADELGLYVLNELPGWHNPYDTPSAKRIVEEMVVRDVNHPCVIFWDNGNEGGWNTAVDGDFATYDPQRRTVLHPSSEPFNGIRTTHYPSYADTQGYLENEPGSIYLPTEFLHSMYDGGGGAGLADYWNLMTSRPNSGGGFIWALFDSGVVRTDQGGRINVAADRAPDGVVGPYREKEGSFSAIREIWSPILATLRGSDTGHTPAVFDIELTNRYEFTNLGECRFGWKLIRFRGPYEDSTGHTVVASGTAKGVRDAGPGESATLTLRLPSPTVKRSDALALTAVDPAGREVCSWVWPITRAADLKDRIVSAGTGAVTATETPDAITMTASGTEVTISKRTGLLTGVRKDGSALSLTNGPVATAGNPALSGITHRQDGTAHVVQADFAGDLSYVTWRMLASGWLRMEYRYRVTDDRDFSGVSFDYPENQVGAVKWLGKGPYRVWKNRMQGPVTDTWYKKYNDTSTGADLWRADHWKYPEFKGYHAATCWAVLNAREGDITMVAEEDMFLRLYTPLFGPNPGHATAAFPGGNISFLDGIAPIGDKNHEPPQTGPSGQPNSGAGDYRRAVWFSFERKTAQLAVDDVGEVGLNKSAQITARFSNDAKGSPARDVRLTLDVPRGWTVKPRTPDRFGRVAPGTTVKTTWTVTPPAGGFGRFSLKAEADYADQAAHRRLQVWSEPADVVVASGPEPPETVAWYKFDETAGRTAGDSSGRRDRDMTATLAGDATWGAGRIGNAVQLGGTDSGGGHIRLPQGVLAGAREATVACWVKLTSSPRWLRVFDFGFDRVTYMFLTQGTKLRPPELTDNMLMFAITINGSGAEQRLHAPPLPTGEWKHLAVTLSGTDGGGRLYVDGVQVDANPAMDLVPMYLGDTTRNYIGRSQVEGDPYLPGAVDDFRVYGRALPESRIRTLYEGS
ncbi:NEW3 domain-containing protein [Actinoallomurus sp. NBC_01490]|uniref:glycoside hydrolase family 2 TIM barrel-domain containing protein n=1 Tax=Actinoallomurus sp. NBC_01490 TaxID=2903557 RepID=UPI002E301A46|nr:glycoside hydrolase family 2 TIM barrel-domain containing protein [Actinoallomurus sp. NBC_01490]